MEGALCHLEGKRCKVVMLNAGQIIDFKCNVKSVIHYEGADICIITEQGNAYNWRYISAIEPEGQ